MSKRNSKRKASKKTDNAVLQKKKQKTTTSRSSNFASVVAEGHSWTEKGDHFHKGRWTKQESKQLKDTIENYAQRHGIEVAVLAGRKIKVERSEAATGEKANKGVSKKAWLEIANESNLNLRTLQSIYAHGCRICDPRNYQGKWSENEMKQLTTLVKKHGSAWGDIAEALGRERRGVQEKWNKMEQKKLIGPKKGQKNVGVKWNELEITQLKKWVKKYNERGGVTWPADGIEWTKVSTHLKGRSIASLRKKWHSLYSAQFPWTPEEEKSLALAVQKHHATGMDDIPWVRMYDEVRLLMVVVVVVSCFFFFFGFCFSFFFFLFCFFLLFFSSSSVLLDGKKISKTCWA